MHGVQEQTILNKWSCLGGLYRYRQVQVQFRKHIHIQLVISILLDRPEGLGDACSAYTRNASPFTATGIINCYLIHV